MSKEIKNLLLIYIVPICVLSLVLVFTAPPLFSVAVLAMITSLTLIMVGIAFLLDHFDK